MTILTNRADLINPEDAQVLFDVGDRVSFSTADGGKLTGRVEKLNPKRARVRCGTAAWAVPYHGLEHVCRSTAQQREERMIRLERVAIRARKLMDMHGLDGWALRFNGARKKLGECRPQQKLILISRVHALNGASGQVTDTILHEIAHALAGPKAGHGPAWKEIARRLGATPKSCAPESDEARNAREAARAMFRTGDAVTFTARGDVRKGTIVRMNPKRAKVQCGDVMWSVPYARLGTDRRANLETPKE